jgi:hypothetical protein
MSLDASLNCSCSHVDACCDSWCVCSFPCACKAITFLHSLPQSIYGNGAVHSPLVVLLAAVGGATCCCCCSATCLVELHAVGGAIYMLLLAELYTCFCWRSYMLLLAVYGGTTCYCWWSQVLVLVELRATVGGATLSLCGKWLGGAGGCSSANCCCSASALASRCSLSVES